MAKVKVMLPLIKQISKKMSLYTYAFDRRDPTLDRRDPNSIDKATEMLGKSRDIKMSDIRHIPPKSKHTIFN